MHTTLAANITQSISLKETYDNYEVCNELSIKAVCDNGHLGHNRKKNHLDSGKEIFDDFIPSSRSLELTLEMT